MFCGTEKNLTDEHVFPAFMGGQLIVPNGSCVRCNGDFGAAEAAIKEETRPLLNLLKIKNRYGLVPNARLKANIVGLDLKNLPAFMDGDGEINLQSVVRESITEEGRRLRQGFFMTPEEGETFKARGHAKGQQVIERGVPKQIVIEASYTQQTVFTVSIQARRVAAKVALAALAYQYGVPFVLSEQFGVLRSARTANKPQDMRVWIFASEGLMSVCLRTAHQHSVMCYLSAGMNKGWVLVTLFGGLTYIVEVTTNYLEKTSKQFSIFYDAVTRKPFTPIVLCDEMTIIGHVLSPASKFEDRVAIDAQWFPIISAFCTKRGW